MLSSMCKLLRALPCQKMEPLTCVRMLNQKKKQQETKELNAAVETDADTMKTLS